MLPLWIVLAVLPILGGAERFNCRGRILGAYYADAKSGCKAFHVCVRVAGGGIRDFRFFCPPGTLFHQEAQTCTDWGDDDPLACPADLYDGQFDLYKIGSGFDTKKLSSQGTRDEEAEFGLQRAETGDRRSQNNVNNGPASDLRAAHSSDFFSGQRDRGRDEPAPAPRPTPQSSSRQSFRRGTTTRAPPSPTEYTPTSPSPQPSNPPHHEGGSKRKLVRKRPIYVSTQAPTTFAENTPQQSFPKKQSNPPQVFAPQNNAPQSFKQNNQPQSFKQNNPPDFFKQNIQPETFKQNNPPEFFKQNNPPQSFQQQPQQQYVQKPQNPPQNNFQQPQQQQNLSNRGPPRQSTTLAPPHVNVPPQYKDEYVEVPRVAPKKPKNRYFPNSPTPAPFVQSSPAQNFNKKDSLIELYNYEAQSTPGLNTQNENRFKVRNNFQVQDGSREDFARINPNSGRTQTTAEYNTAATRGFVSTTPAYKDFNSVSYKSEKENFVPYRQKQNYHSPSTTPTTTIYTTGANFNTVAYNTNNALNTFGNFVNNEEDDGQYRLPEGEDDGQYRPELYERGGKRERDQELLSGAHSINIAASGNRLYEDQKSNEKSQFSQKPSSKTSAPRPFRPAPTPTLPPTTTYAPEPTYTTTYRAPTTNAQRTFDYFQTYTTTVRPSEPPAPVQFSFAPERVSSTPARPTTTSAPRTPEPRPKAPAPPTIAPPRPSNPPPKPNPTNKQDDSYDYAYYDSDPGFSEYDHIEEFGRTKSKA
ncbi:putative serine/threonine-protein kinase tsuA isoform X2 [Phthorimaea operculella]|nr:putative serine/threonine-protein kinase tsuA isoform X2 [Phthorimaea operculella]